MASDKKIITISGKVVKGQGYGRVLGYPTANIERRSYSKLKVKPKFGVWQGTVKFQISKFKFQVYQAAVVIGPLDKHHLPKIEAHLIGFKGNLYGQKITIALQKYIRAFKKFKNERELKEQILKDIKIINSKWKSNKN